MSCPGFLNSSIENSVKTDSTPEKIVLLRTDRLGDTILSLPVATALKTAFPHSRITFLARDYTAPIIAASPSVDEVVSLDAFGGDNPALVRWLKEQHFDAAVHLFPRPELAWATWRAGIPLRIGTGYRYYSLLFNRRQYDHRKQGRYHEAELNLRLLQQLGITDAQVRFDLAVNHGMQEKIDNLLKDHGLDLRVPMIIIHPGSGGSSRDWPAEHFAALAREITANLSVQLIVTGTEKEKSVARDICAAAGMKPISLAGRLTVDELMAVINRAALFIANSTGPLHLAVALNKQVLAFYPPIQACRPERWGPYGRRQDVLMSQEEECTLCRGQSGGTCACMQRITPEQAFARVRRALSQPEN